MPTSREHRYLKRRRVGRRLLQLVQEGMPLPATAPPAMSDALVADILKAALDAMENGTGLPEFVEEFDALTRRHGWSDDSGGRRAALTFRMLTAQAFAAG